MTRCFALLFSLVLITTGVFLEAGKAETNSVEGVGVISVLEGEESNPAHRQGALRDAIRDGVLKVLEKLVLEEVAKEDIEKALEDLSQEIGEKASRYAVQYRLLADRGIGPVLLSGDENVKFEYVVEANIQVDTELLRGHLRDKGFLIEAPEEFLRNYLFRIEGPLVFRSYRLLLESVKKTRGVEGVDQVFFSQARVELVVTASRPLNDIVLRIRSDLESKDMILFASEQAPEGVSLRIEGLSPVLMD